MESPYPNDPNPQYPNTPAPAPAYGPGGYGPGPAGGNVPQKSKVIAGILGILIGGLGIHQFYLGNAKRGVLQIVVTVLTCGVGSVWGLIEGILYLVGADGFTTDADGRPLSG